MFAPCSVSNGAIVSKNYENWADSSYCLRYIVKTAFQHIEHSGSNNGYF